MRGQREAICPAADKRDIIINGVNLRFKVGKSLEPIAESRIDITGNRLRRDQRQQLEFRKKIDVLEEKLTMGVLLPYTGCKRMNDKHALSHKGCGPGIILISIGLEIL